MKKKSLDVQSLKISGSSIENVINESIEKNPVIKHQWRRRLREGKSLYWVYEKIHNSRREADFHFSK